jgi:hypothetical protein
LKLCVWKDLRAAYRLTVESCRQGDGQRIEVQAPLEGCTNMR